MDDIQRQYLIEEGLRVDATSKYLEARRRDKNLAHFPSGNKIIQIYFTPFKEALKNFLNNSRTAAYEAKILQSFTNYKGQIAINVFTFYTLEAVLEYADKDDNLYSVANNLTKRIQDSVNFTYWEAENPAMAINMEDNVNVVQGGNSKRKYYLYKKAINLYSTKVINLPSADRIRVGFLLLELAAESLDLVTLQAEYTGQKQKNFKLRFTEKVRRWLNNQDKTFAESPNFAKYPMVTKPLDWVDHTSGGFLTRTQPFIRSKDRKQYFEQDSVEIRNATNKLQGQAYKINQDIFNIFVTLKDNNSTLGGLVPFELEPAPSKPWINDEEYSYYKENYPEVIKTYNSLKLAHLKKTKADRSKRILQAQLEAIAKSLSKEEAFYFVYSADSRGRLYAEGNYLNPQANDLGKALLVFATGKTLTERGVYWLKVHLANCYGEDKVSFIERVKWADKHQQEIIDSAINPYNSTFWSDADSPFCFLAACIDYYNYLQHPTTHKSYLAVAMDATCSGMQHLSALLRDPVGGKAVNLTKEDKRFDIYTEVKNRAAEIVHEDALAGDYYAQLWDGKLDRGFLKRQVMTSCYSATQIGFIEQIDAEISKRERKTGEAIFSKQDRRKASVYLATVSKRAIGEVILGAKEVMGWLQEVSKAFNAQKKPIIWTTPTGFKVYQNYLKHEIIQVHHILAQKRQLHIKKDTDQINTRKQTFGISPNVIHSLDAAHLHKTVNACPEDVNLICIHDSFGCHASDVDILHKVLREEFYNIYCQPVLKNFQLEWEEQLNIKLPDCPSFGNLDLKEIIESPYFFS